MWVTYCKTIFKNLHTCLGEEEGIKGALYNLVLTQILMVLNPPKTCNNEKDHIFKTGSVSEMLPARLSVIAPPAATGVFSGGSSPFVPARSPDWPWLTRMVIYPAGLPRFGLVSEGGRSTSESLTRPALKRGLE